MDSTYKLITAGDFKCPSHLSPSAASFISTILAADPRKRGTLNPGASNSLLSHPFIVEGLSLSRLPPSAVYEKPDLTEAIEVPVQAEARRDDSRDSPGCSPGLSFSLRRMKGFFNSKNDFLEQVLDQLSSFRRRENQNEVVSPPSVLSAESPVFINKWIDYSKHFGFLFQLSDGNVGGVEASKLQLLFSIFLLQFCTTTAAGWGSPGAGSTWSGRTSRGRR